MACDFYLNSIDASDAGPEEASPLPCDLNAKKTMQGIKNRWEL